MLSMLSKIVPLFFYPLGIACALAAVAGVALLFNKKKAAMITAFCSAGVLWFSACPLVSHVFVRTLESRFDPPSGFPKTSAIVLLGGCTQPAVTPRRYIETNNSADRLLHAARLFKAGYAPVIISTGGKLSLIYDFEGSEALCMAGLLRELFGVDSSAIIIEDKSKNTHDHAPNVGKILQQRGMKKEIIVVTSAMHMYRSVRIFKKAGYTVFPAPTDYRTDKNIQWNLLAFLPNADALGETTNALHEYYGIIAYTLFGWI
jgi:uncharacterized SAM-binding protein YcdF (DUF218 family)